MSASESSSSTSSRRAGNSYPSSSSATEVTHSSASSTSNEHSSSSESQRSTSVSYSERSLSASSSANSSGSSPSGEIDSKEREEASANTGDDGEVPLKLPRLETVDKPPQPPTNRQATMKGFRPSSFSGPSIFPAPPLSPPLPVRSEPIVPPPRYGPAFPPPPSFCDWAPPPAPPLPTLSASAKDITEVDFRAGVRLGVYRAPTCLNKEQVMDEIESVRMTSSVERVLLETAQGLDLQGVPVEEREYAWATVFFADAEAAELCVTRLCQPGRRSKWSRVCIQRLPVMSLAALPLSPSEEQRYRIHAYQLESAATTPGTAAATTSAVADTVLARAAGGWCVLSTGGLFPTMGLANYLKHRRRGDFNSIEVCADFDTDSEKDTCNSGGQCGGLHLREVEQWKLLLPVVLPAKPSVGTSPHMKPAAAAAAPLAETSWQKMRHYDCLVVKSLPADIDESAFVYMFRGCRGFLRAQTVRTVDQVRYGVVQFHDATRAQEAREQAIANAELDVRFYGEVGGNATAQLNSAITRSDAANNGDVAPQTTAGLAATAPDTGAPNTNDDVAEMGATHEPGVPFPPLPGGWEYGLSRRTMQYFFLQSGKKSTTWKHPVTQEQYKAKR